MNKLTLVSKEINDECPDQLVTVEVFSCNEVVDTTGSIWADSDTPSSVVITEIWVQTNYEGDKIDFRTIFVKHNGPWQIYTSDSFAEAISDLLGYAVDWTEQGMQDDCVASLE